MMITPSVSDQSPTNSGIPRRTSHQIAGNGNVVTVNQLRLSKKTALNHRENVGSLDHISVASSSSSIRKMKSDLLFSGQRLDRNRTGSTPMSDVPSEQRTPNANDERRSVASYPGGPRSSTPTLTESHDSHRHCSVPDFTTAAVASAAAEMQHPPPTATSHRSKFESIHSGDAESIASDPGDRGEESSSDDDASVANTDGQFVTDAFSEEDSSVHRSAPSLSEKGMESVEQTNISKNLPESFKMPIMPFPPTTEVSPSTSTRSLSNSRSIASAARIRTRQRGLERRLGITDTWASDRLISKQSGSPRALDLLSGPDVSPPGVIREEGIQTARELRSLERIDSKDTPNSSQQHRRTASEQDVYLNSLRESLKNVGDSKTRIENYGRLLESVEERLLALAAAKQETTELREANPELVSIMKLLKADESQKQIKSFFEAETVERTITIVQRLSEILEKAPTSPPREVTWNSVAAYDQILRQAKEMVLELKKILNMEERESPERRPAVNTLDESCPASQNIDNQETSSSTLHPVPSSNSQDGTTQLVHLWMERVDPGVSIVFQSTNQGTTKIKKIRFAKRMFAWDAAQRWWEQNQERLIRHYQLEPGFDPLNQAASDS